MDLHEVTDFLKNEYTGEKTKDLRLKTQGLTTRKPGTYDSKVL